MLEALGKHARELRYCAAIELERFWRTWALAKARHSANAYMTDLTLCVAGLAGARFLLPVTDEGTPKIQ